MAEAAVSRRGSGGCPSPPKEPPSTVKGRRMASLAGGAPRTLRGPFLVTARSGTRWNLSTPCSPPHGTRPRAVHCPPPPPPSSEATITHGQNFPSSSHSPQGPAQVSAPPLFPKGSSGPPVFPLHIPATRPILPAPSLPDKVPPRPRAMASFQGPRAQPKALVKPVPTAMARHLTPTPPASESPEGWVACLPLDPSSHTEPGRRDIGARQTKE